MDNTDPDDSGLTVEPAGDRAGPAPAGKKVCSGCGAANQPTSDFCYKCGVRLPHEIHTGVEVIGDPAGFWVRFWAHIIDSMLLLVIGIAVTSLAYGLSLEDELARMVDPEAPIDWSASLLTLGVEALYFTVAIAHWGRTIGKAMLRVKVVRMDGSDVSYLRSFFRYLTYYISWLMLGLGFLLIPLSPQKRGIHDLICDTRVVRVGR